MSHNNTQQPLSDAALARFIQDGFIKIERAFPKELADEARAILWKDTGCNPEDQSTWTRPVIRLGMYPQAPFVKAANTPILHQAFDQLVGPGRWSPCRSMGTFPIRFPSEADPGDVGWHVDMSFGFEDPDFFSWRVNLHSMGRALLMLFLFSDVGDDDAPTRLRVGSHLDLARQLAPFGDTGLSLRELAQNGFAETAHRPEASATGEAGTVYLCHPFLVHTAQLHRGARPRFMAQPPLLPKEEASSTQEYAPVRLATERALQDLARDALLRDAGAAQAEVKAGTLRGAPLVERLRAISYRDREVWLDAMLGLTEAPPDAPDLPQGAVPYLPAAVDEIVAAVLEAPLKPEDVLVDLGAGIGRVVILAHLLSGASAHGIELQRHLVECAEARSQALGLSGVSFECADAAEAELRGAVFFLYSPFNGDTLRRVLGRLQKLAQQRPITLCAVGLELPDEPWLSPRASSMTSLTFYDSTPQSTPNTEQAT